MKLQQGQVWKLATHFVRIVNLERLAVDYKLQSDLTSRDGEHVRSTKKAFCRLIKGSVLISTQSGTEAEHSMVTTAIGTKYFEDEKTPLPIPASTKKRSPRKR